MKEKEKYEIIKKLVEINGNKERAKIKLHLKSIRQINKLIAGYKEYGKEVFKNKGLIKGYWRIISPHSVLMTEIRGIFNLPIENSSR